MAIRNQEIADIFSEIADLLEVQGSNPFRIRAYRNASRIVEGLGQELASMVEQGDDLTALDGIGKDLAKKIEELVAKGRLEALDKLHEELPADITRMLRLPGLGPKRVATLYHDLGIKTLDDLAAAARAGRIRELPGLGKKTEEQILASIEKHADQDKRFRLADTVPYVESYVAYLEALDAADEVTVAGSYRRRRETVGDIDILVCSKKPVEVMDAFVVYEDVESILAHGETKSSVTLRTGLQVDCRVVPRKSFGVALHYFTGSKAHNIAVRRRAQQRGLKVNEYGVTKGEKSIAGKTEKDVYESLDLSYVEPELREDHGELEAAERGEMPKLVEVKHIRGDLHAHTTASDGSASIAEMASAAKQRGYEYLAITEHSKSLTIANGLDEERLREQIDEIDQFNAGGHGITVLKGIEVDILVDGALDMSDDVLRKLDLVVASVHTRFNLPKDKQTERILRAMDHDTFTILGHPSGRLILARDPFEVDMERVIGHAAERGCYLEVNANPQRLDLHDAHCRMAKEAGVGLSIDTDAHRVDDFANIIYGVGQARRGWLEKENVLNTRTLKQLLPLLRKAMNA